MRNPPADAKEVHVYGQQWLWQFEYKNGKVLNNEMVVPVGTPVKLIMTSKDVLHSFYVPSFRIKQDVIPGRYTMLWFQAEKLGEFHVFCTEYCGLDHSKMLATLKVVPVDEYEKWLGTDDTLALSPGARLYQKYGCEGCHSLDGSRKTGPSFKGLFGRTTTFDDGTSLQADENYIRESLVNPTAKTVKTFPKGAMPSFQGQLSEEDLTAIIEFIKSQK
jgi:cytochrome c oxidase subunit 2